MSDRVWCLLLLLMCKLASYSVSLELPCMWQQALLYNVKLQATKSFHSKCKSLASLFTLVCMHTDTHTHTYANQPSYTWVIEKCKDTTKFAVDWVAGNVRSSFLCAGARGYTELCSLRCYRFAQL